MKLIAQWWSALNRTTKGRVWVYMTQQNSCRDIVILLQVVASYNDTIHSTIGYATFNVDEEAALLFPERIKQERWAQGMQGFIVRNQVRLAKKKQTFKNGYETNFTNEIFKVVKVISKGNFLLYEVCDLTDEPIKGSFYEQEPSKLIMFDKPYHRIAKVLKQRTLKNVTIQYLI